MTWLWPNAADTAPPRLSAQDAFFLWRLCLYTLLVSILPLWLLSSIFTGFLFLCSLEMVLSPGLPGYLEACAFLAPGTLPRASHSHPLLGGFCKRWSLSLEAFLPSPSSLTPMVLSLTDHPPS